MFVNANKSITANFLEPPTFFNKLLPLDETTPAAQSSLTLSWSASSPADSYEYCSYTTNHSDCDVEFGNWVSAGSSTTASISNLLPPVTYHWQVRARNQGGYHRRKRRLVAFRPQWHALRPGDGFPG